MVIIPTIVISVICSLWAGLISGRLLIFHEIKEELHWLFNAVGNETEKDAIYADFKKFSDRTLRLSFRLRAYGHTKAADLAFALSLTVTDILRKHMINRGNISAEEFKKVLFKYADDLNRIEKQLIFVKPNLNSLLKPWI